MEQQPERFYFTEGWKKDIRLFSLNRPIFFGLNTDNLIIPISLNPFEFQKLIPKYNYNFVLFILYNQFWFRIDNTNKITNYSSKYPEKPPLEKDSVKVVINFTGDLDTPTIESFNLTKKLEIILLRRDESKQNKKKDVYYFINWFKVPKTGKAIQYKEVGVATIDIDEDSEFLDVKKFSIEENRKNRKIEKRKKLFEHKKKQEAKNRIYYDLYEIFGLFEKDKDGFRLPYDIVKKNDKVFDVLKLDKYVLEHIPFPKIEKILQKLEINFQIISENEIKIFF